MATSRKYIIVFLLFLFIAAPILSFSEHCAVGGGMVLAVAIPAIMIGFRDVRFPIERWHVCAFLLWVSSLISTIAGKYGKFSIETEAKYLIFAIFYIFITRIDFSKNDYTKLFKLYVGFTGLLSLLIIFSWFFNVPYIAMERVGSRFSIDIIGVQKNPNYITSYINLSAFVCMYVMMACNINRYVRYILGILVSINAVAIYLSGTRAALLAFIVTLCLLVLFLLPKKKLKYWIGCGAVILIIMSIGYSYLRSTMDSFLAGRSITEDESREVAWLYAIQQIFDSPILGCGVDSFKNMAKFGMIDYLHNVFLEIVLNQGLIGLVMLLIIIFGGFKRIKKNDRLFVYLFLFSSGFQLAFQNGAVDVNLWKFLILNRLIFNCSLYNKSGLCNTFFSLRRN